MSHADIAEAFRAKIRQLKATSPNTKFDILASDASLNGKSNRFVAIIDSIASNPGVYMPWKEMVKICKEEGVWSVIDAAHSIGQEVGSFSFDRHILMMGHTQLHVNLSVVQPDFWVSNCHKWLYVKRGCAVFYAAKRLGDYVSQLLRF
jgi:hercynylcysteine S-oxide lyase